MNYLAHIRLAGDDPECLAGNFIGDFVKGKLAEDLFTPGIRRGIRMHRSIDAWTDSHELTKKCVRLVSPARRRWGRAVIDIFFDHLLAANWDEYSDETLGDFLERAYGIILASADAFPPDVEKRVRAIIDGGWLERYGAVSGLRSVFEGMSARVRRENPLAGAERELADHYEEMNGHFGRFFPEALEYAERLEKALLQDRSPLAAGSGGDESE